MSTKLIKPNLFLTGGTGFIAPYFLKDLAETYNLYVHVRDLKKIDPSILNLGINFVTGEFENKSLSSSLPSQFEVVFHLAGAVFGKNCEEVMQNNVVTTKQLLRLLEIHKTNKLVFMSTAAVWDSEEFKIFNEEVAATPTTPYGFAKLAAESLIKEAYNQELFKSVVVLRCNNTYGLGSVQGVVANFINKLLNNHPIEIDGDGSQLREPIYISDMIDLLNKSLKMESGYNVYGISGAQALTIAEIAEKIANALDKKLEIKWKPRRSDRSLHLQIDTSKALRELGWKPLVTFDQGIKLMAEKIKRG